MEQKLRDSAQRVQDFLTARGFAFEVKELPGSTRTSQEAADSIGLTRYRIYRHVVLPQALRHMTPPLVSQGAIPLLLSLLALALFYAASRKRFAASRNEAVQALFVLLFTCFLVLTVTGIWFRGEGMALVWPWQS